MREEYNSILSTPKKVISCFGRCRYINETQTFARC